LIIFHDDTGFSSLLSLSTLTSFLLSPLPPDHILKRDTTPSFRQQLIFSFLFRHEMPIARLFTMRERRLSPRQMRQIFHTRVMPR